VNIVVGDPVYARDSTDLRALCPAKPNTLPMKCAATVVLLASTSAGVPDAK
jgi:hypothetical protein